jgi:hypothetical protein
MGIAIAAKFAAGRNSNYPARGRDRGYIGSLFTGRRLVPVRKPDMNSKTRQAVSVSFRSDRRRG